MTFARERAEWLERREAQKAANRAALCVPAKARGVYAPVSEAPAPAPKDSPYRDPALMDMAKDRPCLLLVPGICNHRTDTTVTCHQNEGKGMAIKAPDNRSVWGCVACHTWLDQSGAPREQKRQAFAQGLQRQMRAWRQIAMDAGEPARFRKAARLAVEELEDRE
jgi:hypothetical protein